MKTLTAKELKAVLKAQKLIEQANALIENLDSSRCIMLGQFQKSVRTSVNGSEHYLENYNSNFNS